MVAISAAEWCRQFLLLLNIVARRRVNNIAQVNLSATTHLYEGGQEGQVFVGQNMASYGRKAPGSIAHVELWAAAVHCARTCGRTSGLQEIHK